MFEVEIKNCFVLKSYVGDIYAEKKHGNGVLSWSDGRVYSGAFYADQRHGFGTFQTPNVSEFRVRIVFLIFLCDEKLFSFRVSIVMMNDLVQEF